MDLHTIIERQKIGIFVRKIELEWPGCIDHLAWETSQEVFIYLQKNLLVSEFVNSLMPKINMFIDFKSPLIIHYIQHDEKEECAQAFNFGKETVILPDLISIVEFKFNASRSEICY